MSTSASGQSVALPAPRRLQSHAATGAIFDHGAHLVDWTPAGHAPVLWMSGKSAFAPDAPIRGGVPICLPWFATGPAGDRQPPHGFARLGSWTCIEIADEHAQYEYRHVADERFPHDFTATYDVSAGAALGLRLTMANTGATPLTFEAALHTYFAVGDVREVRIEGLEGHEYRDRAPGASAPTGMSSQPITFTGETDRIYRASGAVTLVDPILRRRIRVTTDNAANTVVWNPWTAKSAAMPDFGDDEWPGMCCIEAANVLDGAITLQPGERHTMSYRVDVVSED